MAPPSSTGPAGTPNDKELPEPSTARPGTSGTELNLRVNRQKASSAFQRAQRAEQAYRAKRQATNARTDMKAAKAHLKEGGKQLKLGVGCVVRAVKAIPAVVMERREAVRVKRDAKMREKLAEEKKKWDQMAMEEEETEVGGAAGVLAGSKAKGKTLGRA